MTQVTLDIIQSDDTQSERCRRLWGEVIIGEVKAALWTGNQYGRGGYLSEREQARRQADAWLRGCGEGMRDVCENAGIDPEFVREAYVGGRIDRAILSAPGRAAA